MVEAAQRLLDRLSPAERDRIAYPVDAVEWQTWANPEFMQFDTGLRLENLAPQTVEAVFDLVRASTSEAGFTAIRTMMRINGFLGEVVDLPLILSELSYNIALYGTPSTSDPWGWQLYGHHCAVNALVVGGRLVMAPVFRGAEPDAIDEGPHACDAAFATRIDLGRRLMGALTPEQRAAATVYEQMVDPAMPEGRVHPGDERHLAGAFQDNRVIPYEGVRADELSDEARDLLLAVVDEFVGVMPPGPARAKRREVEAHLGDTWFSWIGGHGPDDVFYYRVQSPVVVAELDHHCGVFPDYDTPQAFHVHTVLRTPNGNDYGRALVRQWQDEHDDRRGASARPDPTDHARP
ncbi:DUF3500 domain-containing protein [Agilicoccus flavus]|uniref:DUF3500 domain-containing protein n=1 Tax=Agilicoccus flavus TaxID=2775968 RepID=UPI0021F661AF|nr:DUF3500 domain-containing protein [Agilicoccus flavus]